MTDNFSARVIKDSVSVSGDRITTFELEYPRFIHSEFMTHRLFSRNAASSRAIPVEKVIERVRDNPAMPVHWGLNQPGMQASKIHDNPGVCERAWKLAADNACEFVEALLGENLHKQVLNRLLEPFQTMKVVCTATEYDNFFYLRRHTDAQPEIRHLADLMWEAYKSSEPQTLQIGEWHLPYVDSLWWEGDGISYVIPYTNDDYGFGYLDLTLEQALKVSASCCAQVSFRKSDTSLEKAEKVYDMLVSSKPVHASPFEHQASPIKEGSGIEWETTYSDPLGEPEGGITHYDRDGEAWSGNFKGWIQHRQLIDQHCVWDYKED